MKYKYFIFYLLISLCLILLMPACLVYIIDPLQIYHSQVSVHPVRYSKEERYQNLGLVNEYIVRGNNHDMVIFGTSMSQNFKASNVVPLFETKGVLKLTMAGGRPLEQHTLAQKVFLPQKIKKVIWDIHWYFLEEKITQQDDKHAFPYKLYSDNPLESAYFYLMNEDMVLESLKLLFNKSKWETNLDQLSYWMDRDKKQFREFEAKKNRQKLILELTQKKEEINFDMMLEKKDNYVQLDKYLISIIESNPNVEFNFYFPPYFTFYYATMKPEKLYHYLMARKYLVERFQNSSNVRIFAFDDMPSMVNDIQNYKDYGHYRANINQYIAESIAKNQHRLVASNVNQYLEKVIQNIQSFQIKEN